MTFQGYDYNNKGEVSVLVNNQVVATLPTSYASQNAKTFVSFTLDISNYIVSSGSNTITFRQNQYSSGVQNVKVTGPNGVLLSDSTYRSMRVGGTVSVTYKFNTGTTTTTSSSSGTYTLAFQGYDYDNKGEVSILVNNQVAATLPTVESSQNNNLWKSFSLDISKYVVSGSNTIVFKQNMYSSGLQSVKVTGPNGVLLSDNTYHSVRIGGTVSVTYKFSTTTTSTTTTSTTQAGFRFVVLGDSRSSDSTSQVNTKVLSSLTNVANGLNPAFAIFNGDLCYSFTSGSDCPTIWKNAVNQNLLSKTVLVQGNRDTGYNTKWQSAFKMASIITSFGGTGYSFRSGQDSIDYSFNYKNSHFVGIAVLNGVSSSSPSYDQLTWLDADLTKAENTGCGGHGCALTFIAFHSPLYCVSPDSSVCSQIQTPPSKWTTILNAHSSVVAVFNAHDHVISYVHISSNEINGVSSNHEYEQFISGASGAPPASCGSRSDWCTDGNFGFITVNVSGSTAKVRAYNMYGTSLHSEWSFSR
ncbi:MAG: hypothetical protein M1387_06020 [Thaumarchaeota archaeon]|nr:hypothetical protein [Nitrososphaerota archaeon]